MNKKILLVEDDKTTILLLHKFIKDLGFNVTKTVPTGEEAVRETILTNPDLVRQAAAALRAISVAEKQHEKRYLDLAANIEAGRVFKRDQQVTWRCRNCGYLHVGASAPELCPACLHPQAHFELLGENW